MWQQKRNVRKTVHAETELMGRPRERPRDFEKPRSPENDLVPKERADWKKQLHELQEKCGKMERQLFYTEQHNRYLKDNLQQEELNGVDEQPRKVDIGLQINIPLRDISDSQELLNSEGNLEEEVGRPREVLQEREEQFGERSLMPEADVDTLALLTQTEAALRESEEKSSRLEKELQEIVSEQGEKQLSRTEESVSVEPCGPDNQAINHLYDLCDHWENIINQMMETERKVQEETKVQELEESRLQQETQHLHVEKVQLQQKEEEKQILELDTKVFITLRVSCPPTPSRCPILPPR
ncbi:hypothetical protein D4764_08G0009160 [Takifugu flavidus]|uniref:Uncharacterized protein n=1 Tax=Takifugu flavidus TaxID=433684 RepID=A0A5C6MQ67_9TELE|nr:hypothetical protein D4764_08G0009160 [Takifugu flavidus]